MTDWIRSLLSIGATDGEDTEERLRRALVVAAAALVMPAAALWGLMYLAFGESRSALVPWSFVLISSVAMVALARTKNYPVFAGVIFITFLILPFLLMWSLGGFVSGSAVALWSWLSPLGARIVGHRRTAVLLFTGFALGLIISALVQPRLDPANSLSDEVIVTLFVLNVVAVGGITLVLVDASSGGREGSLESMRGVVRRYFSSDVADAILSDPGRQELGGEVAEITVLFADLGGYTTYAGDRPPDEVVELLNTIFAEAVPAIIREGGTPIQIPGDAVMAIFGAPRAMRDHAQRAARAALAIQDRGRALAAEHPGWPRFRIGLNSGPAVVGNIGSDEFRNFTAIGDTVNMAQRFQTMAEPGQVVTGPSTAELLDDGAELEWLDARPVKGKSETVRPCVIRSVSDAATSLHRMSPEHRHIPYRPQRTEPTQMDARAAALYQEMDRRRSVRDFSTDAVPRRLIEWAIRTASTAPSGAHQQPWTFVALSDPVIKRRIRVAAEAEERRSYEGRMSQEWLEALVEIGTDWHKPFLETAPWIVVLFEQIHGTFPDGSLRKHYYARESAGIAAGLFIAAIHHMGLATVTHTPSPMGFLRDILGRPRHERPFVLFPVGYPADDATVPDLRRKSLDEVAVFDPTGPETS